MKKPLFCYLNGFKRYLTVIVFSNISAHLDGGNYFSAGDTRYDFLLLHRISSHDSCWLIVTVRHELRGGSCEYTAQIHGYLILSHDIDQYLEKVE